MWTNRLTKKTITVFGAYINHQLVGIVLAVMNPRKKIKHVATLNSMYVKANFRGKAIGEKLIVEAVSYLSKENVEIVNLSVVTHNKKAISLYEKLGFKMYGEEKRSIKLNGKYIDQFLMTKAISI